MSDYLPATWAIDGVALESLLVRHVKVLSGAGVPPQRGSDRQYAFKAGAAHRKRTDDSRSMQLGFWIMGELGPGSTEAEWAANFRQAVEALNMLLRPDDGDQFSLTRTQDRNGVPTTATAQAISGTGVDVGEFAGIWRSKVTVDLHLADPYFYGDQVAQVLSVGVPTPVFNAGDTTTHEVIIELDGQLTNPQITNATPNPDVFVKVGSAVASGSQVVLDIEERTVKRDDGANLIAALTHSGARAWMPLRRGTNQLTLTADAGTGTATIRHQPIYY